MAESLVYLHKTATNQLVEASLFDEITDEHLFLWKNNRSRGYESILCRPGQSRQT